jgi:uncharacterized membrane protein YdjX (TVP38/TMEM64 family)
MSADATKLLVKPLVLTALLTVVFVALHAGWLGGVTEEELLRDLFSRYHGMAWPVFVLGGIVYTALGAPRQVLAFACGYLLGGWWGGVLATVLTALGALLTIAVVRLVGTAWLDERHVRHVARVQRDTWLWICVIRLMPVGSNLLTNMAAALAGLDLRAVLLGSLAGYLPQSLLFAYAGRGVALQDHVKLWISLGLLVASSILAWWLYHHGFKQRLAQLKEGGDGNDDDA